MIRASAALREKHNFPDTLQVSNSLRYENLCRLLAPPFRRY